MRTTRRTIRLRLTRRALRTALRRTLPCGAQVNSSHDPPHAVTGWPLNSDVSAPQRDVR